MSMVKRFLSIVAVTALAVGVEAQAQQEQKPQKNWKDQQEYALYQEIIKPDLMPAARLQKLDQWKMQYPMSEFSDVRQKIYLVTYQQTNNHRAAVDTATEILKSDPNDLQALTEIVAYGLTLVPSQANAQLTAQNKADLDNVEKTARYVLANLDKIYAADKMPQGMTADQWAQAKPTMQKFAQFTIARAAMAAKDTPKAEDELKKTLEMDPTNAQASYALAGILLSQQKEHPDKMPLALFEYARAATYDGPGALPAATRTQVDAFLTKAYNTYHTDAKHPDAKGLADLKAQAKAMALPPADFHLASIVDILTAEEKKRQEEAAANPMMALWTTIKNALLAPDGQMYFETSVKDAGLPPADGPFKKFKGKLVSATPETKPKELTLAVEGDMPDTKIVLTEPLPGKMDPGGELQFSGIVKEYSKEPYMLTFEVEPGDIEGWTGKGPAPRPATKKAGPAPAGATKKKQ